MYDYIRLSCNSSPPHSSHQGSPTMLNSPSQMLVKKKTWICNVPSYPPVVLPAPRMVPAKFVKSPSVVQPPEGNPSATLGVLYPT